MLSIAAHNPGERDDLADYRESIQVRLQLTRKKFETHCIATHTHTHTHLRSWSKMMLGGKGRGEMNKRWRNTGSTMILMTENAIVASRMVRRGSSRVVLNGIIR